MMSVLVVLMPIAIILGVGFVVAFILSVRTGQYDDLETPAHRVLLDDVPPENLISNINNVPPALGSAERKANEFGI